MKPIICVGGFDNEKLKLTAEAGFEEIELNFSDAGLRKESDLKEYLDYIKELGLKPVAGNCFFPWNIAPIFGDKFEIEALREFIAAAFEKTASIKWESIAFGSGAIRRIPDGVSYEKASDIFAGIIVNEVVPYLEKYDAYLNIEELNSNETNFLNSCTETVKLIERINHPRVKLLCDFFHMSLAGETAEDVPSFVKHISHLHIASPLNSRAYPFENDGDNKKYKAFFKALKDCGYNKEYVSLEGTCPEGMDFGEALKASRAYLLKEFAETGV